MNRESGIRVPRRLLLALLLMFIVLVSLMALFSYPDRSRNWANHSLEKTANSPVLHHSRYRLSDDPIKPLARTELKAVWANNGSDKVFQHETRMLSHQEPVASSVWDGEKVSIFGARNEVVSFALILETGHEAARGISLSFDALENDQGEKLTGAGRNPDDLFDYNGRNIELFHIGYLQIKGLSKGLAYETYDERHVPSKCRGRLQNDSNTTPRWKDRLCANRFIPDIAVPLALKTPFTISPHASQMIWADIYIPKNTPAGIFRGEVTLREKGKPVWVVPVQLNVRQFTLPDTPSAKTMVAITAEDINARFLGEEYPETFSKAFEHSRKIIDRYFQLAHRHKLSLIDTYTPIKQMDRLWLKRLDGSLFTPDQGYAGPGMGVGNNVYAIGLYGSWPWKAAGKKAMWHATNQWVDWFRVHGLAKATEYFLYLADESEDYGALEQWAEWIRENPGSGQHLAAMATVDLPRALEQAPALSIPAAAADIGIRKTWERASRAIKADRNKELILYNGRRPATGSFALEDDGIALRQLAWTQFKKKVDRWFYWNATYYNNVQCVSGHEKNTQTNVFVQARTFGCADHMDRSVGETGFNYFNGDGLLMYPGTDRIYPAVSLGIDGPIASLRMKYWRRGIQDVDYLTLAAQVDRDRTNRIVTRMIPKVLWEYGVGSQRDPSWVNTDISWSVDPDDWEQARAELAAIIEAAP